MGGFKIAGLNEFKQRIRQDIADTRANIERAISEIGDVALHGAVEHAPIDEGILGASLEKSIQRTPEAVHAVIRVPLNAPASDYATAMHEDIYELGPKSLRKAARNGLDVGRKYIEKGVKHSEPKHERILKRRLQK